MAALGPCPPPTPMAIGSHSHPGPRPPLAPIAIGSHSHPGPLPPVSARARPPTATEHRSRPPWARPPEPAPRPLRPPRSHPSCFRSAQRLSPDRTPCAFVPSPALTLWGFPGAPARPAPATSGSWTLGVTPASRRSDVASVPRPHATPRRAAERPARRGRPERRSSAVPGRPSGSSTHATAAAGGYQCFLPPRRLRLGKV